MSKTILAIIETHRFPLEVAKRAARIAKLYESNLELVLLDPTLGFLRRSSMISAESEQIAATVELAQKEELDGLVDAISDIGVEVTTSIVQDRPGCDAIVAKAYDVDPLVVVKGTTYHSTAERAISTFDDWQLIRKLDYPLWLVKSGQWPDDPTIVAAVDPMHPDEDGELSQSIVSSALSVADKTGGTLLLLHTYELLEAVSAWAKLEFKPLKVPMAELEQQMRDQHWQKLEELATSNSINPGNVHILPGRTREILPAFAREQNASLVVMGAVARSGLKQRIIGSTAEHVLDHVPCDILIERAS